MSEWDEARPALSSGRAVFLIARREFISRVQGRVFVIGSVVAVILIGIYVVVQMTVISRINGTSSYHLGYTASAASMVAPVRAAGEAIGIRVQANRVSSQTQATRLLRDGNLDALVTGSPTAPLVLVKTQIDQRLEGALNAVVRQEVLNEQIRAGGLDPASVEAPAARASIKLRVLEPPAPGALQQPILGFVVAFALYFFLGIYGGVIGQGVVAEKASRVVEVLLSTVRAHQLLLGKVVGIGLAGLVQFGIIAVAALAMTLPTHVLSLPSAAVGVVLAGLLWFVLGFLLYALLGAASASLVSRVEEVSTAMLPITLLMVLAWLLAYAAAIPEISAATTGQAAPAEVTNLATVTSLIPVFSPVLMPIRIAGGVAPWWQVLLAVLFTLLSIAGTVWLGGRVYANSVLRFGGRVSLKDALRRP